MAIAKLFAFHANAITNPVSKKYILNNLQFGLKL